MTSLVHVHDAVIELPRPKFGKREAGPPGPPCTVKEMQTQQTCQVLVSYTALYKNFALCARLREGCGCALRPAQPKKWAVPARPLTERT